MSSAGGGPSGSTIDPYRPLKKSLKSGIVPLLDASTDSPPTLAALLPISETTYASRLSGKLFQLHPSDPASSSSPSLVTGRKRNRGDATALANVQAQHAESSRHRKELGLQGGRREKQRAGGIVKRGMKVPHAAVLPLHYMHCHYLAQLLSLPQLPPAADRTHPSPLHALPGGLSPDALNGKLVKADFTGIHLAVRASRSPTLIGLAGIVIEETASTFALVPPDSRVRIVPKDGTQFQLSFPAYAPPRPVERADGEPPELPDMAEHLRKSPRIEVLLLGSAFGYRSGERAGRKFRPAQGADGSGWGLDWVDGEWSRVLGAVEEVKGKTKAGKEHRRKRRKKEKNRKKDGPIEDWMDAVS